MTPRRLLPLLAAIALALAAPHAAAQSSARPVDKKAEAKARFQQGDAHLQAGAYQAAIDEFLKAYELFPNDRIHFNIAQAYRLKGDREKALEHYLKYLNAVAGGDTADEARRHTAALRRALAEEAEAARLKKEKAAEEARAAAAAAEEQARKEASERAQRDQEEQKGKKRRLLILGGAAGGVALIAIVLGVGLGVGLRSDGIPSSSLGTPPVPVTFGLKF